MLTQILLWLNIPICLVAVVILLTKRSYPAATLLLSSSLIAAGGFMSPIFGYLINLNLSLCGIAMFYCCRLG